jgi:hypothetical protein
MTSLLSSLRNETSRLAKSNYSPELEAPGQRSSRRVFALCDFYEAAEQDGVVEMSHLTMDRSRWTK